MKILYEPKIVALIDVLGFTDLIDRATTADEAKNIIALLEHALQYVGIFESTTYADTTKMFSDCMCISGAPTVDGINWVFWRCITIQAILIEHGLLSRGAITEGKHYQSDNIIFSEALVNSYFLERDKAIYPRIIVAQTVADRAKHYERKVPYPPPSELILEDEDGLLFLDYFHYIKGPCEDIIKFIQRHREVIEQGAQKLTENPRLLEKYRWMATYHNRKAEELIYLDVIPFIDIEGVFAPTAR